MKTIFNKAWLWLPRDVADGVVDTAELHLSEPPSPPVGTELFWAKSDYQYWCWILWFHWLRQHRAANPSEAEKPSQKMILAPFHLSADLIAQWGLDGGEGTLPEWLAPKPPVIVPPDPQKAIDQETVQPKGRKRIWFGLALAELKKDRSLSDAEIARRVEVAKSTLSRDMEWQTIRLTLQQQDLASIPRGTKYDGCVDAIDD